jgi:hypothetical protein
MGEDRVAARQGSPGLGIGRNRRRARVTRPGAQLLRERLSALQPGDVAAVGPIAALLAVCWNEFAGSGSERMHAGKLGRMEAVQLDPRCSVSRSSDTGRWAWARPVQSFSAGALICIAR